MSKPQPKSISTTVFIVEGIQTAILVTTTGHEIRQSRKRFASPGTCLAWCRQHRANMVYAPSHPTLN